MFAFVGFGAGIYMGAALAPIVASLIDDATLRTLSSIFVTIGVGSVLSFAGREFASRTMARWASPAVSKVDRGAGVGVASFTTLFVVWLMASMLAVAPLPVVPEAIHGSSIVRALNKAMPPAPAVISRLRQMIAVAGFPDVFAELEPEPGADVAIPADPEVRAVVEKARASTVKILGEGCGGVMTGSGVVASGGLVVTNAHVVAGVSKPKVMDGRVMRKSTVVLFDPRMDVAILRVDRTQGKPLPFASTPARQGQTGAALGYPGGGPFTASPAGVIDEIKAVGRDIYGRELTTRRVVRIRSDIRPGNSGGPLVAPDGVVIGIIFSKSAFREGLGYALASRDVAVLVASVEGSSSPVSTGPCAS